MMAIFEILHPDCIPLIAFDNSSNQHAMENDALVLNRPNLTDEGKNMLHMRPEWFLNSDGSRIVQQIQTFEGK